jgi:hypothetical protein
MISVKILHFLEFNRFKLEFEYFDEFPGRGFP